MEEKRTLIESLPNWRRDPWAFLLATYVILTQTGVGILAAVDAEPSGPYILLDRFLFLTLIGLWIDTDSRRTRALRIWDMGFYNYICWAVVVPYYLIKTRGRRRGIKIMGFWLALYFGSAWLALVALHVLGVGPK